jgi:hypothetical protein
VLRHLKVVVLDLYIAYLGDPLVYVAYPRGSDAYGPDSRLRKLHLGLDSMKKVIDSLSTLGYLEDHGGFKDRTTGIGYLSRMRATSRLIDLINNYAVVPSMISREEENVLLLRDKDGNDIPYPETDVSIKMRDKLTSYNSFLEQHEIAIQGSTPLSPAIPNTTRVTPPQSFLVFIRSLKLLPVIE